MTLEDVSKLAGLSKSHISRIEKNETNGWDSVSRLLAALGLTLDDCRAAGVDWWALAGHGTSEPAPLPTASADADFLIKFVNDADADTLHALRVLVETMRKGDS